MIFKYSMLNTIGKNVVKSQGSHVHLVRMEAYSTCTTVFENVNNINGGEAFVAGQWYHVAVSMGSIVNGKKNLFLMAGAQPGIFLCAVCR